VDFGHIKGIVNAIASVIVPKAAHFVAPWMLLWRQLLLGTTSYCSDGKISELGAFPEGKVFTVRINDNSDIRAGGKVYVV